MNGKKAKLLRRNAFFSYEVESDEKYLVETFTKFLPDGRSFEVVRPIMWKIGSFRQTLKEVKASYTSYKRGIHYNG